MQDTKWIFFFFFCHLLGQKEYIFFYFLNFLNVPVAKDEAKIFHLGITQSCLEVTVGHSGDREYMARKLGPARLETNFTARDREISSQPNPNPALFTYPKVLSSGLGKQFCFWWSINRLHSFFLLRTKKCNFCVTIGQIWKSWQFPSNAPHPLRPSIIVWRSVLYFTTSLQPGIVAILLGFG